MPDGNQQVAPVTNQQLATMPLEKAVEFYAPNFKAVLPPHVPLELFKRMMLTAVSINPDLYDADRRSLFNAAVKCASDGLLPDGREAALVVYNTKIKDADGKERYVKTAQYLPMIRGIRKRMRNTGEVLSAEAHVVYQHDKFYRELGDTPKIVHEPPPLDQPRGDPVGAYAIIKLANGETLREVMPKRDIERARAASRSKDKGPWVDWWDEMARKTVLRRCAKGAPGSSELERMLARDEEEPELPAAEDMPAIPPRPRRQDFIDDRSGITAAPDPWVLIDADGAEEACGTPETAAERLQQIIDEMRSGDGERGVAAAWENNAQIISRLREEGRDDLADDLAACYADEYLAASEQQHPGVRQDRPQEPKDPIIAPGGATYPKLAAAVDQERKPSEGHHSNPADEAGGSSEANARQSAPAAERRSGARGEEDGQRRASAVEAGGSPATTEDYWSRQDLILDPPLRPGTAAIDLPRLRDELCNRIAAAPSEARLDAFLKHNRPNLNRLIGFKDPKTQTAGVADVQAAVGVRRKALGAAQ